MTFTVPMPGTIGGAKIIFNTTGTNKYSTGKQATVDMFDHDKIGIVGVGFVGGAIKAAMDTYPLVLVDSNPAISTHSFEELFECRGIFVCVPSPQSDNGQCDTSILEDVLKKLEGYTGVVISKSTAPPDVYERLNRLYPNLVHAPEFLTAANAVNDYASGKFAIVGGRVTAYVNEAIKLIKLGQTDLELIHTCTIGEASMAKYIINTFLATKVIFMNEMHQLAEASGLRWDTIRHLIALDDRRVGNSHTQVPGPDGQFGFGGACFPKDTAALLKYAEQFNIPLNVLDAAVKKNTLLRLTEPK
jgi:UDPglucose 6-dehydrogenase